jgi:hypothetical protein
MDISKVKKIIIEDYSGDKEEVLDGYDYERKLKETNWNALMKDPEFKSICGKVSMGMLCVKTRETTILKESNNGDGPGNLREHL